MIPAIGAGELGIDCVVGFAVGVAGVGVAVGVAVGMIVELFCRIIVDPVGFDELGVYGTGVFSVSIFTAA